MTILINRGANVNAQRLYSLANNLANYNPVVQALMTNYLLSGSGRAPFGTTALHIAVENNDFQAVELLLASRETYIDPVDENGETPLIKASKKGDLRIAKLLLNGGAYVNTAALHYGYTALHMAAARGDFTMVTLLLQHGAHIHVCNLRGQTPYDCAVGFKHHNVANLLQAAK